MRIELDLPVAAPEKDINRLGDYVYKFAAALGWRLHLLTSILNGQLTFGDAVDTDNIHGKWVTVSSVTPGAEITVAHNLGITPVGFILMTPPAAGVVNKGSTPWTTLNIYLTCTSAPETFTIFVLGPPQHNI